MKNLALVICLALLGCSCSSVSKDAKIAEQSFIDCAKTDIGQAVSEDGPTILEDVATLIMTGGDGWQAALEDVGKKFGTEALACAVRAVDAVLVAHGDGSPSTGSLSPAAQRAMDFLAAHPDWRFAQ